MAVMPNGCKADTKFFLGQLCREQVALHNALMREPAELNRLTHVRQCLNFMREGTRLKLAAASLPLSAREVQTDDWGMLIGTWQEYFRTLEYSHVVIDPFHHRWCLQQLRGGAVLEADYGMHVRTPAEQLALYFNYNETLKAGTPFEKQRVISDQELKMAGRLVSSGLLADDDLVFYSHNADALTTAYLAWLHICSSKMAVHNFDRGLSFSQGHIDQTPPQGGVICSEPYDSPRPMGFYLRRLTPEDRQSGVGRFRYSSTRLKHLFPMSSEAFQLFGITHICPADLRRTPSLAVPGFYGAGFSYFLDEDGPRNRRRKEPLLIKHTFTIGSEISGPAAFDFTFGTTDGIRNSMAGDIPWRGGYGYLSAWEPKPERPASARNLYCANCRANLYLYDNFAICSYCGQVSA